MLLHCSLSSGTWCLWPFLSDIWKLLTSAAFLKNSYLVIWLLLHSPLLTFDMLLGRKGLISWFPHQFCAVHGLSYLFCWGKIIRLFPLLIYIPFFNYFRNFRKILILLREKRMWKACHICYLPFSYQEHLCLMLLTGKSSPGM